MNKRWLALAATTGAAAAMTAAVPASAAITKTRDAAALAAAMSDGGAANVTGAAFTSIPAAGTMEPHGVADGKLAGMPRAGSKFAILTNGNAEAADDANGHGSFSHNGAAVRGDTDRDVSVLEVSVNVPSGHNCLTFDFQFFSEEYPTYVGKAYNDAFIAELDQSTWKTAGSVITAERNFAFDAQGKVVSVNATGAATMNAQNAAGTAYGGGTVLLHASTQVTPGVHKVIFSIFDQGDAILDSAVFIDRIVTGQVAEGSCKAGATDQPPPTTGGGQTGPVGSKPPAFGPGGVITGLPPTKKCVSRRSFKIRIKKRKGREYVSAQVFVNGKQVVVVKGSKLTAPVNLKGLPKGRYKVKIVVVTTTGEVIQGTRKYRTCTKRIKSRGPRGPL